MCHGATTVSLCFEILVPPWSEIIAAVNTTRFENRQYFLQATRSEYVSGTFPTGAITRPHLVKLNYPQATRHIEHISCRWLGIFEKGEESH